MARIENAAFGTACPVKDLAITVQLLQNALWQAEEEKAESRKPGDQPAAQKAISAMLRYDALYELITAKRDHAITMQALSPEGALHQLAIASALVEELSEQAPSSDENAAAYYRAKELRWLINWALYSIGGVLEAMSITPRNQLGAEYYMEAGHSPYLRAAIQPEAA